MGRQFGHALEFNLMGHNAFSLLASQDWTGDMKHDHDDDDYSDGSRSDPKGDYRIPLGQTDRHVVVILVQ